MLERDGFAVWTADDAGTALAMLDHLTPDLLILDIAMPGTKGIELLEFIRARADMRETPVVMLIARSDAEAIGAVCEAGASAYLVKPVVHHDLVATARSIPTHSVRKR
jgi:DNA-binding response OmpR family regulator